MRLFLCFILFSSFFLSGCRKPDPMPELRDPIYSDIQAKLGQAQQRVKAAEEKYEFTKALVEKIEPQIGESGPSWAKYFQAEKDLRAAKQMVHYWNLKLINRKYAARNSYIRFYNMNRENEWPQMGQFKRYKINQRLKNAPRKWNSKEIAKIVNK